MAQRIRLTVRYDGTDFAGSQVQPGKRTVAGTLKAGLESLLEREVKLDFASRTDSGVHADGNVAAFSAELPFGPEKLPHLLSRSLPHDLIVTEASAVPADFHPRFDAVSRTYTYRVWLGEYPPADRMRYVWGSQQQWQQLPLADALKHLRGEHDFSAFSGSGFAPEKSRCNMAEATMRLTGSELAFTLTANRFLRHMVVRIVGALAKVGSGEQLPEALAAMLSSGERFQFRPAPAQGLTLVSVKY